MENDLHHEIKIAQFWRSVIGEFEYVNYDPADLFRWYEALETRGPDEIRAYLNERAAKYPMSHLLGLVSMPPHPPMNVVMLWLEAREQRFRSGPIWLGVGSFLTLCLLLSTGFIGCENLKSHNILATNPGQVSTPLMQPTSGQAPTTAATMPVATPQPMATSRSATGTATSDGAPAAQH